MQKAFEKIVERLEEYYIENKFETNSGFIGVCMDIVNQVAEEYSHRNSDLVIDSSHRITSLDEVINRLQYKADNIKAKLEPSYFTECIDYLKSLNDGWIPCERELPSEDGFYNVTVKFWHVNKPTVMSSHFECGKWTCVALDTEDVVLAWQPLPTAYVKGE